MSKRFKRISTNKASLLSRAFGDDAYKADWEADLVPTSWDESARTFDLVLSTGARGLRWADEIVEEELSLNPAHVDLTRANNRAPFSIEHRYDEPDYLIGFLVPGSVMIEAGRIIGKLRVYDEEDLAPAALRTVSRMIKGHVNKVSITYSVAPGGWRVIPANSRADGGVVDLYVAVNWKIVEAAIVGVSFDDDSQTRSEPRDKENPNMKIRKWKKLSAPVDGEGGVAAPADPENQTSKPPVAPAAVAPPAAEPVAPVVVAPPAAEPVAAVAEPPAQNSRHWKPSEVVAEVVALGNQFGLDPIQSRAFVPPDFMKNPNTAIEQAGKAILQARAISDAQTGIRSQHAVITADEADKQRRGMFNALVRKMDARFAPKLDGPDPFMHMTPFDMALHTLQRKHVDIAGKGRPELAQLALMHRANTVDDFSEILGDAAVTVLKEDYKTKQANFWPLVEKQNLPDFEDHKVGYLGEFPDLIDIPEGGKYEHINIASGKEYWHLSKSGAIFAVTWETILASARLQMLARMMQKFNNTAIRKQSNEFWAMVAKNDRFDGTAYFSEANGNLVSAATLGRTGLKTMRVAMASQATDQGDKLHLKPRFIVLPTGLYEDWLELTDKNYLPTSIENNITSENRALDPIQASELDDLLFEDTDEDGDTAHYLVTDPMDMTFAKAGFLEGEEGPQTERRYSFESDGLEIKTRLSFGCTLGDPRAAVRNAGNPE